MPRLTDLIGETPMVELAQLSSRLATAAGAPPAVRLLAKLEGNNPGGSVKDRAALAMIEGAEARGALSKGVRIIEPTSGNTGIALAMIASAKGYQLELVMPAGSTAERVQTMRAFGATVTLTPDDAGMEGAIDYAHAEVKRGGAIMLDQFSNPDNWAAHYRTTGPEIWRDTRGEVTHFVSSMGTTGTIMGVSRFLKERAPTVKIVGVQPTDGSRIPGIRRWPAAYLPKIFERERVDRIVDVDQRAAEEMTRRLAREEGVFTGVSGGGAVVAALEVARELTRGVVVLILPDRGDRYLSSGLFAGGAA
jgi:cysteine synthase B